MNTGTDIKKSVKLSITIFCIFSRKKNTQRLWSRIPSAHFGGNVPAFQPAPARQVPDDVRLPYDFLRLFITDEFVDNMCVKSKLYCIRKGGEEKTRELNKDNILASMGLMYLSGYITPAQKELWWENRPDTQHLFVKKAMARDTFRNVLKHSYFVTPEDLDRTDPFWKVRPLFDEINSTAKSWVKQTEYVSVDETIVRYFGPHFLKQSNLQKPDRFGWKVWVMATPSGELLVCQPYAGARTKIPDVGLGQGPNVVYGLAEQFDLQPGTKIVCDNLFTSFDLLDHLNEKQLGGLGNFQKNPSL